MKRTPEQIVQNAITDCVKRAGQRTGSSFVQYARSYWRVLVDQHPDCQRLESTFVDAVTDPVNRRAIHAEG